MSFAPTRTYSPPAFVGAPKDAAFLAAGSLGVVLFWAIFLLEAVPAWHTVLMMAALSQVSCFVVAYVSVRAEGPFSPLVWFSAMYFLLPAMAAYLFLGHFGDVYHHNVAFRSDRIDLMERALLVALAGYISYCVGHFLAPRPFKRQQQILFDLAVKDGLVLGVAYAFYAIGILNFGLNAWLYDSANLASLLLDYGARDHRLDNLPAYFTTIGYNLLVVGLILHMFIRIRTYQKVGLSLAFFGVLTGIILLSTGRVWYTFSVGLALFACWNICLPSRKIGRTILGVGLVALLVVAAFILRIVSNLLYVESDSAELSWLSLVTEVAGSLGYLIFGRSNVPSLPILMEVVDYYGVVVPYLYGESLSYWMTYLLPGEDVRFLGHEIKETFYAGRPGGFPPTVFGEFYANGGMSFVVCGCALLGFLVSASFRMLQRTRSFIGVFVYSAFLFRFVFMLPKLELASFGSAVWLVLPALLTWFVLFLLARSSAPSVRQ